MSTLPRSSMGSFSSIIGSGEGLWTIIDDSVQNQKCKHICGMNNCMSNQHTALVVPEYLLNGPKPNTADAEPAVGAIRVLESEILPFFFLLQPHSRSLLQYDLRLDKKELLDPIYPVYNVVLMCRSRVPLRHTLHGSHAPTCVGEAYPAWPLRQDRTFWWGVGREATSLFFLSFQARLQS